MSDLPSAAPAGTAPIGAPDIIPLLPRGDTVFEGLPARALVLEALAPAIGDGLMVVRQSRAVGVLLVRSGRLSDAYSVEPEHKSAGEEATARIRGWDDAVVSAWRLSRSLVDVLPPLVRGDPLYADLRLEWIIWGRLLADLRSRPGTFVVEITTPAGRGVTSIRNGLQVATYTDRHPELGDPSLIDEIAEAGSGAIRVLRDSVQPAGQPAPPASARAREAEPVEESEDIAHVFGVPQRPSPPFPPDPVPALQRSTDGERTVAQLLPQLKRLVQERLHQSSLRLEILLEDAAANNASLDSVVGEVRATPIRGVMQSTLDELADEMLALGQS